MNWPWNRSSPPPAAPAGQEEQEHQMSWSETLGNLPQGQADDGIDPNQPDDPLAHLDEGTRGLVEQVMNNQLAAQEQQIRQNLGVVGLDLGHDFTPVIPNPRALSDWAQPVLQQGPPPRQQQQVEQMAPPPQQIAPPPPEEIPDFYSDPQRFQQWLDKLIDARADTRVSAANQRTERLEQQVKAQTANSYVPYVTQLVEQNAPWLEPFTQHPEFGERVHEALLLLPQEQWQDPSNLVQLAGMVAAQLGPPPPAAPQYQPQAPSALYGPQYAQQQQWQQPGQPQYAVPYQGQPQQQRVQPPAPRARDGRYVNPNLPPPSPDSVARAAASRAALPITGPSREAGRQPSQQEYSIVAQSLAQLQGISLEEAAQLERAAASGDYGGESTSTMRRKRLAARR